MQKGWYETYHERLEVWALLLQLCKHRPDLPEAEPALLEVLPEEGGIGAVDDAAVGPVALQKGLEGLKVPRLALPLPRQRSDAAAKGLVLILRQIQGLHARRK